MDWNVSDGRSAWLDVVFVSDPGPKMESLGKTKELWNGCEYGGHEMSL